MPEYSQAEHPLRIETALGKDALLLQGLEGSEGISTPFRYTVDLLSENPEIAPGDILRTGAAVTIGLPDGEARTIHGIVSRFAQRGQMDELTSYRCELVPWLWFLTISRECRIFQEMSVLEIAEKVFKDHGYSDFELRCVRSYPKREYCVQYRESHFDFVSRLLEEEGIFYFFEHSDAKHTLVLADDNSAFDPCDGTPEARMRAKPMPDEDVVTLLERTHSVHAGTVALADYDYLQPSFSLHSEISGDGKEEVYDYHPERYKDLEEGDRYARLMLERAEAEREVVEGEGTCRNFQSGRTFDLKEHYRPDANQTWLLTAVRHRARGSDYRTDPQGGMDYRNEFKAIPSKVPWRPHRRTPKPTIHGSQTAVVVGKKGEAIWVDKHGRVKVQFHWDRQGKSDDDSSCWVRVSQNWAGAGWGGSFVPHVGQEVIVAFLEGDPDRPIITGRVYNAKNQPPLGLPGNQTKSIIRDHGGNEIVMEGESGAQQIRLESPTAASKIVIGAPNQGNIHIQSDGQKVDKIKGKVTNKYDSDFLEDVLGNEFKTVNGTTAVNRRGAVKEEMNGTFNKITYGVESSQNLSAKSTTTIGVEHSTFVGGKVSTSHAYTREVNRGWKKTTTSASSKETVDGPKSMSSGSEITLTVGGAQIIISDDTIIIGANKIVLNGTDFVEIKSGGNIKLSPSGKVTIPKGKLDDKFMKSG